MGKRKRVKISDNKAQSFPLINLIKKLLEKIFFPIKREFAQRWLFYLTLLIAIPFIFLFIKGQLLNPDGIGYFSYTRSLIMDRDLKLSNELKAYNVSQNSVYFYPTHDDYISNLFAIGTSLAWIPSFLLAHLLTLLINLFAGSALATDGNS